MRTKQLLLTTGTMLAVLICGCGDMDLNLLSTKPAATQETQMTDAENKTDAAPMEAKPITGRCHCGYFEYKIAGPIEKFSYCGCEGCRRATGAFKIPFVTVKSENLNITAGEYVLYKSDFDKNCDSHGKWAHCPKCHSPIAWISNDGKQTDLFAGTLNDSSIFKLTE